MKIITMHCYFSRFQDHQAIQNSEELSKEYEKVKLLVAIHSFDLYVILPIHVLSIIFSTILIDSKTFKHFNDICIL